MAAMNYFLILQWGRFFTIKGLTFRDVSFMGRFPLHYQLEIVRCFPHFQETQINTKKNYASEDSPCYFVLGQN